MDLATFQGIGQGINQGVAHGLNVGMRLREQESIDRHRQVLEEQTKAQTAVTNLHAEELRKKEEDYNSVVDITKTPMFLSLPDNVKPDALKFFSDNGYTDAVGKGTKGNIAKGAATISSTDELLKKFMAPKVEEAGKKVLEAWDKYELAKQSGDPEKVKKAYAEYRNFYTDYTTKSNGLDNQVQLIEQHNRKLQEEENKKEEGLLVVGHDVLDKKTRKRVYRAPFAPSSSSQEEGKLTDIQKKRIDVLSYDIKNIDDQMKNTLAKDKPALEAKRAKLEKERNDLLGVKTEAQPKIDIAQERKWAQEAISKGGNKATIARKFKARTGQSL